MQMFTVPQFIDVEDKIIGPITTRQFIISLVALGILVPAWKFLTFGYFAVIAILDILIFGAFAFVKINGRPFHYFILNLFQTFKRPKLRVWYRDFPEIKASYGVEEGHFVPELGLKPEKHYSTSRLAELSLIVDTKGAYGGGSGNEKITTEKISIL
jgi:hypothetical protein